MFVFHLEARTIFPFSLEFRSFTRRCLAAGEHSGWQVHPSIRKGLSGYIRPAPAALSFYASGSPINQILQLPDLSHLFTHNQFLQVVRLSTFFHRFITVLAAFLGLFTCSIKIQFTSHKSCCLNVHNLVILRVLTKLCNYCY